MIEAEVVITAPLVVKPVHGRDAARLCRASGGKWRLDKLANAMAYRRSIEAVSVIAAPSTASQAAQRLKQAANGGRTGKKGTSRPAREIVGAISAGDVMGADGRTVAELCAAPAR